MYPSEPLPHFVDDYLAYLYEVHPALASLDGVHLHDDLLEDLSRSAIDSHIRALSGFSRRLHQMETAGLSPLEQVEHGVVSSDIESRLFELEVARTWERSPHFYADTLATSLATQTSLFYAPEADRARRVLSKLRQLPRLVQAARDNIKEAPGILVKVGLESWRGVLKFLERDLPRAFATLDDLHILSDLADASTEACTAIEGYVAYLETDLAPKAKASFRLGRDRFELSLKHVAGITISADRLLQIVLRQLSLGQERFEQIASKIGGGSPAEVWKRVKEQHPGVGQLLPTGREQLAELAGFLNKQTLVSMPGGEVAVGPAPEFSRASMASLWTPGPFESKPTRSWYYLTDIDKAWPEERKVEHLRELNIPTLWTLSFHEVYPGHFLHGQHLRQVESKVRKSVLLASRAFVEGWAHYGEQLMMEAGFRRADMSIRLAQVAETLVHLARVVVAIRLHCEDLSVEQGVRFFREEAFLEEPRARREAERGTFDPGYVANAVGKLMLVRLRRDVEEQQAGSFSLRTFHDTLLAQGAVPFWAHRRIMLPGQPDPGLDE